MLRILNHHASRLPSLEAKFRTAIIDTSSSSKHEMTSRGLKVALCLLLLLGALSPALMAFAPAGNCSGPPRGRKRVMLHMLGVDNETATNHTLTSLVAYNASFNQLSWYTATIFPGCSGPCPNWWLGDNQPNTSAHAREILGADVELWPAIACSDISALQNVMTYMGQWIHDAVAIAVVRGYHGYMVDIELVGVDPWSHAWCTSILVFLTQFANALRAVDKGLNYYIMGPRTGDTPCFTAMTDSTVDKYVTMDTYAPAISYFEQYVDFGCCLFGSRFGVGMSPSNDSGIPLPLSDVNQRFEILKQQPVDQILFWAYWAEPPTPLPSFWWDLLAAFLQGKSAVAGSGHNEP
jgi:hypothetical protein